MSAALAHKTEQQIAIDASPISVKLTARLPNDLLFKSARLLLSTAFVVMLVAALHPEVRSQIRGSVVKDFRTVVSTVSGDLRADGSALTVVKVKTRESLSLEIYAPQDDGTQKLLERVVLPNSRDGYFSFNGQATNLAIDDIDGDGAPELLVPTFDANLVGHLSIYRFDPNAQTLRSVVQ